MDDTFHSEPIDLEHGPRERVDDRAPIDVGPENSSTGWIAQATLGFVALGVLLRATRYLLNFPFWCDETMLAANFLDRGYADLFRPLDYRQVSPLLFLGIELTAVKLLGFSELSLRLFPALCGVASVPLFWQVARRLFRGVPLLLAVAIFAVSGWPLRFAAEVKPYASDLFVALGLTALAIEWRKAPSKVGWLWVLAATGPVGVALSLPAVFTVGAVGLALLVPVWRSARRQARVAFVLYGGLSIATFSSLLRFYKTAPQDHDYFHNAWAYAFPPLSSVWRFIVWFLDIHTGFMFAYPDGGRSGASALTFLAVVATIAVLWRRGSRTVFVLLLAPFGLALVAAALHRYPYGVHARTMQYAAPVTCLLAGLGAAVLLRLVGSPLMRRRLLYGLTAGLAALGVARLGSDLTHPYKFATDERARSFARWFWTELSRDGELACAGRDLGVVFEPKHWTEDATDTYLCYQKIFSPRHRSGAKLDLGKVSAARPLRCVFFNETPGDDPSFQAWFAEMLTRYDLSNLRTFPVSSIERKRGPTWDQLYVVYEFVPKPHAAESVAKRPDEELRRR